MSKRSRNRPNYKQPHNIDDVVADNPYLELILVLKQHGRDKQDARYNGGNGSYKSPPIKRLPYRD